MKDEAAVEQMIQEKGLTAPRITPDMIQDRLDDSTVYVHRIADTTTMIAVVFDQNGFSLATGMSACASPENFDEEVGEKIAIENAISAARDELWKLEGYRLKRSMED